MRLHRRHTHTTYIIRGQQRFVFKFAVCVVVVDGTRQHRQKKSNYPPHTHTHRHIIIRRCTGGFTNRMRMSVYLYRTMDAALLLLLLQPPWSFVKVHACCYYYVSTSSTARDSAAGLKTAKGEKRGQCLVLYTTGKVGRGAQRRHLNLIYPCRE